MLKLFTKYLVIIFLTFLITYNYYESFTQLKLIPKGFLKIIFPEKRTYAKVKNYNIYENANIINANSFDLIVSKIDYFSGFNLSNNGTINSQHKSAAFFGIEKNNNTILEVFTRDGQLITKEGIKSFVLPNSYDPHNSQGGIRGVFYFNNQRYAFMAILKIGCQAMSLINLDNNTEIFQTDCLPDYTNVHYDGVGGASLHDDEKIYLSIGTPTNSSDKIRNLSQDEESFYGKIISIDKKSLQNFFKNRNDVKIKIITKGHRNPQGLAKINNTFFNAEHGPKGGDEINLIVEGKNYGWPISSYGTKYENMSSASYKLNHFKYGFEEPLIQFTPSIAISDLTNCPKNMVNFYDRNGCLIATTLKDKSLVIILLNDRLERVIGIEKIDFEQRLRHIAKNVNGELFEDNDESIYITTDSGEVLKVLFRFLKD